MEHGVGSKMNKVAAVKEWRDLHTGRKDAVIQLFDLFMNGLKGFICVCAFAQQHDSFDHVPIVKHAAVGPMNRFADLPEANLWTLRDRRDVSHTESGSVLCL